MQNDNRVLGRTGARLLSREEVANVSGATKTLTVCSFLPPNTIDGDVNECS